MCSAATAPNKSWPSTLPSRTRSHTLKVSPTPSCCQAKHPSTRASVPNAVMGSSRTSTAPLARSTWTAARCPLSPALSLSLPFSPHSACFFKLTTRHSSSKRNPLSSSNENPLFLSSSGLGCACSVLVCSQAVLRQYSGACGKKTVGALVQVVDLSKPFVLAELAQKCRVYPYLQLRQDNTCGSHQRFSSKSFKLCLPPRPLNLLFVVDPAQAALETLFRELYRHLQKKFTTWS